MRRHRVTLETLDRKLNIIMAQIDDLNTALNGIATDVTQVVSDHADLISQLQAAQAAAAANQPVDLTTAIASAQAIKTTLDGIASTVAAAAPAPATDPGTPASTTPAV